MTIMAFDIGIYAGMICDEENDEEVKVERYKRCLLKRMKNENQKNNKSDTSSLELRKVFS